MYGRCFRRARLGALPLPAAILTWVPFHFSRCERQLFLKLNYGALLGKRVNADADNDQRQECGMVIHDNA